MREVVLHYLLLQRRIACCTFTLREPSVNDGTDSWREQRKLLI